MTTEGFEDGFADGVEEDKEPLLSATFNWWERNVEQENIYQGCEKVIFRGCWKSEKLGLYICPGQKMFLWPGQQRLFLRRILAFDAHLDPRQNSRDRGDVIVGGRRSNSAGEWRTSI